MWDFWICLPCGGDYLAKYDKDDRRNVSRVWWPIAITRNLLKILRKKLLK